MDIYKQTIHVFFHKCLSVPKPLSSSLLGAGAREKNQDMVSAQMELIQRQMLIFKDLIFKLL